ncbi:MAG TPA: TIGR04083 family peptide-modifying radical SAM enzyme [Methanobacteriaceae archaeon]|nr:TIGR04083 family peptide-modifying radical SAM enzyme [Methanobacteriaceae archaeon]
MFHVMLVPTLNCPSNCSYCWGSKEEAGIMDIKIIQEVVNWLKKYREDSIHFTFHGGEPLLAGYDFYKKALPLLKEGLGEREAGFSLQSNLWLLTDELAQLLREYNVAVSSSLDGPEDINELQRGEGYFDKTMKGYEVAQKNGLPVNFICTFTSYSKDRVDEIFDYFLERGYNLKLHPALPSLRGDNSDPWAISPEDHGELLINLLDKYLEHLNEIEIKDFDHFCKSYFIRKGTVCILADCLGDTLAVDFEGNIYPCYRFVEMPEYVMGNVLQQPTPQELQESPAWKTIKEYMELVDEDCKKCRHIKYCRGGCPYNALQADGGEVKNLDPQCTAYKMIFGEISKRATKEMMSNIMPSDPNQNTKKRGIMSLMIK